MQRDHEANCRALAGSIRLLSARGEPVEQLVEGLPVSLETVCDAHSWVDWETFTALTTRLEELAGGPEANRKLAQELGKNEMSIALRRSVALAVSPTQLFTLLVRWLGPSLYPVHRSTLERFPDGRIHVTLEIPEDRAGCAAFLRASVGVFEAAPAAIGLAHAHVESIVSSHRGEYWITLPPSQSLWARLRRVVEVFMGSRSAIDALAEQQEQLQRSYDALNDSYAALQDRERRLEGVIEEQQRTEQALRDSEAQLLRSQRLEAMGRLAGGIAHDFNNLMTAVLGYTDLLESRIGDEPEAGESLHEIRAAAERATRLTGQLLSFSRRQPIQPQVVDLNTITAEMDNLLRRTLGGDVKLRVSLDPDLRPVYCDPSQLEQVILNLAVNARDAMEHGGSLDISTENLATHTGAGGAVRKPMVRLTVTDSGIGMSEEVRACIFEPFYTTKEVGRGTGLGLATVYGIVSQARGRIEVESKEGAGTTFTIDLPAARSGEVVTGTAAAQTTVPAGTGSATVLLVEDESSIRRLTRRMLESGGYRVLDAEDGAGALKIAAEYDGPIDLLLSDVMMRGLSGPELAAQLRELRPEAKVLLVSGIPRAEHGDGTDTGMDAFLPKPFNAADLLTKVREVLQDA